MKSAVLVFPGSNCDRDLAVAIEQVTGRAPAMVWHRESELPEGPISSPFPAAFPTAIICARARWRRARRSCAQLPRRRSKGVPVLGICNGFQVLTEAGLLPGALMRNAGLHFVCRPVGLKVENSQSIFTARYQAGEEISVPVAHHDGNYQADAETLDRLEGEGRVAFRYTGEVNGSARSIAGILNTQGNVLGMMPHPERASKPRMAAPTADACSKACWKRSPSSLVPQTPGGASARLGFRPQGRAAVGLAALRAGT